MSNHRRAPSLLSIAGLTLATSTTVMLTGVALEDGLPVLWREQATLVLGVLASAMLLGHVSRLTIERAYLKGERERERVERSSSGILTGTWGPLPDNPWALMTVLYDSEALTMTVQGWISEKWQIRNGRVFGDWDALARLVSEVESDGLAPRDDAATWEIRRRLGLAPIWPARCSCPVPFGKSRAADPGCLVHTSTTADTVILDRIV